MALWTSNYSSFLQNTYIRTFIYNVLHLFKYIDNSYMLQSASEHTSHKGHIWVKTTILFVNGEIQTEEWPLCNVYSLNGHKRWLKLVGIISIFELVKWVGNKLTYLCRTCLYLCTIIRSTPPPFSDNELRNSNLTFRHSTRGHWLTVILVSCHLIWDTNHV
jgi:hypothetical protein